MGSVIISKSSLQGSVKAPPSKAYTHRAVVASALSRGRSVIKEPLASQDTLATLSAVKAFGADVSMLKARWVITGSGRVETPKAVIDCGESGATIRFVTPVAASAMGITVLSGRGSLLRRPQAPLLNALRQLGVKCYSGPGDGAPPLIIFGGGLSGGRARVRGDVSSQYISGLLFASPLAEREVKVEVAGRLESKPYVEMTLDVLKSHGIKLERDDDRRFIVAHGQDYKPTDHVVEGDYSSAAFLMAAAALSDSNIKVRNLRDDSLQGDRQIVRILQEMSADVKQSESEVKIGGRVRNGITVDASDIPDLVPAVAVLGCFANGATVIRGVERLRYKESDRVASLIQEVRRMGVAAEVEGQDLIIRPRRRPRKASFESHNDHRIAMACCAAALGIEGESRVSNPEVVSKSYPTFLDDLKKLGGKIRLVE